MSSDGSQAAFIPEAVADRLDAMGIDFTKARDVTFRVLFEHLPGERTGIVTSSFNDPEASPVVANFDRHHYRLTFTNDAVIKLGSTDKWSRHAGDEYGAAGLDEPSHYGEDLHDLLEMVGGRLRGVDGPKVQLWTLTGNGYNAAWQILEQQEDKNGDPIGLDIAQVGASTLDYPYLAEADKDRFRRQYAHTDREAQALHGGFAATTGLVYPTFSRDTHVIDHDVALDRIDDTWRVYGYDKSWRDPRILVEFGRTEHDQLVAIDEYYEPQRQIEHALSWLEDKPHGTIYAEHAPEDIQRFKKAGHRVEKVEKALDDGVDEVCNRLQPDEDDRPGLLVSDACENLVREFLSYKIEHVGKTDAEDHALDVTRYVCRGEVSISPRGGGVTIDWGQTSRSQAWQRQRHRLGRRF